MSGRDASTRAQRRDFILRPIAFKGNPWTSRLKRVGDGLGRICRFGEGVQQLLDSQIAATRLVRPAAACPPSAASAVDEATDPDNHLQPTLPTYLSRPVRPGSPPAPQP